MATNLIIAVLAVVAAFALFVIRYIYTMQASAKGDRAISYKWIGWYPSGKITGTSTDWFRRYMRIANKMTTAMWGCLVIAAALFFLNKMTA